jgi:hypothetical protein
LVLTPQNPFYVLQAGETAYSAQDIPLAMKFFLMAIEMAGDDNDDATPPPPTGIAIRAWYGVELVCFPAPYIQFKFSSDQPLSIVLVGSTSRGRSDAGHFLAVKNPCTRTPAAAAEARAGRNKLGASWPGRRRIRSVVEVAKPMRMDRVSDVVLVAIHDSPPRQAWLWAPIQMMGVGRPRSQFLIFRILEELLLLVMGVSVFHNRKFNRKFCDQNTSLVRSLFKLWSCTRYA